jgi:hypothetical protein
MGVRCVLGPGGACENLPGVSVGTLEDPVQNIAVGASIVAVKKKAYGSRWANYYNGDPDGSNRYGVKLSAVSAALGGTQAASGVGKRVRQIVRILIAAVRNAGNRLAYRSIP